jgi:hypothetical protein
MAAVKSEERESWIRANFPEDSLVGFASSEELSFLVNAPDSFLCGGEQFYRRFSIKLILENFPRLTEKYNTRCLPLLKEHYKDFYDGLVSSGSVFGKEAVLPCEMRECDQDEYEKSLTLSRIPFFDKNRHLRSYEKVRAQMRKKHITFEPVTPELILLLEQTGAYPPLNEPMASCVNGAAFTYGNGNFRLINGLLRSEKSLLESTGSAEIARVMSGVLPGLLFPFNTNNELVVWRADNMDVSTDTLVVSGFLSTTLCRCFTTEYGDKRNLKINMPRGTPFLPVIISKNRSAEIALLPGTKLSKVSEKTFGDGTLFVEYDVTSNPPPFEDLEVATILRAAFSYYASLTIDVPSIEEQLKFIYNLINTRYNGDF